MDHEEAARMQATSRYLIGDLTEDEASAFEEHFFECVECAEEVRMGAALAEGVRAVFKEQTRPRNLGWFTAWRHSVWAGFAMPAVIAAACVAVAVLFLQNVGLRRELAMVSRPQQPSAVTLKLARGAEAFHVPKNAPFWEARFRLADSTQSANYQCAILRSGKEVKTVPLNAPSNGQPFSILMRTSEFPAGSYLFEVRASNSSTVLSRYSLDVVYD